MADEKEAETVQPEGSVQAQAEGKSRPDAEMATQANGDEAAPDSDAVNGNVAQLASFPGNKSQNAGPADDEGESVPIDLINSIPITLKVVLGSVEIPVSTLMKMHRGEIISLDRKVGEPVDIMANGRLIARGEIIVMEEKEPVFGITLTELVGAKSPLSLSA